MNEPITELPKTWAGAEVCAAYGITDEMLAKLISSGKVGYILGKKRARRFMPEHLGQIRAALEVKPKNTSQDDGVLIGMTETAARRRRRTALNPATAPTIQ